jgi:benzaldehyde dehydrogenase (NAD)
MIRETKEQPIWHGKVFSSNWVEAQGGVANVVDPSNGNIIGVTGVANGKDVDAAVNAAKRAQKEWAAIPFSERAAIVRKAAEKLKEREHEFADWNVRECGAIRPKGL